MGLAEHTLTQPLAQPARATDGSLDDVLVSIGTWLDADEGYESQLQKFADAGYTALELDGFGNHATHERYSTEEQQRALGARIAEMGITVSGYAANFHGDRTVHFFSDEGVDNYIERFKKEADMAANLGSNMIRVDGLSQADEMIGRDKDEVIANMGRAWAEATKYAHDKGMFVSWEFEPEFLGNTADDIVAINKAVYENLGEHAAATEKSFGVMYDTCHGETVAIQGHRHYDHDGKDAPQKFGTQVEFIDYITERGVEINHVHLIGSDGGLHHDKTSTHIPFGHERDHLADMGRAENYSNLVPHLLEKANLRNNIVTVDLCFWDKSEVGGTPAMSEIKGSLENTKLMLQGKYQNIKYVAPKEA